MITLTAKINLLSGDNSALLLGSNNLSGNNISSDLGSVVGAKKQSSNPFIIGASKIGDGSTFSDKVSYFIGDRLSDENGSFINENVYDYTSESHTINKDISNATSPLLFRYGGLDGNVVFTQTDAILLNKVDNTDEKRVQSIRFNPTSVYLYAEIINGAELVASLDGENNYNGIIQISQPVIDDENNISVGIVVLFDSSTNYPSIWDAAVDLQLAIKGTLEIEYRVLTEQSHNPYEITINNLGELKSLTFAFDTANNRHPKTIRYNSDRTYKDVKFTRWGTVGNTDLYRAKIPFDGTVIEGSGRLYDIRTATGFGYAPYSGAVRVDYELKRIEADILVLATDIINKPEWFEYLIADVYIDSGEQKLAMDDDSIFTLIMPSARRVSIEIDNWNTPNYPLVITGIYAGLSINIDRKNLISISRSIFDRSDLKLPSYGIISNTGNIEFNDFDGEVRDYAEQLLLESGLKCEIKLNNTLTNGATQTIGLFKTDEWDYDNDNRVVSVSLKDDLEEWQDILLEEYPLQNTMNMYEIYQYLVSKTPSKWNFVIDSFTRNRLESIICSYPYLEENNLWAQWQKLCEVCALYIYKNNLGEVVIKHYI